MKRNLEAFHYGSALMSMKQEATSKVDLKTTIQTKEYNEKDHSKRIGKPNDKISRNKNRSSDYDLLPIVFRGGSSSRNWRSTRNVSDQLTTDMPINLPPSQNRRIAAPSPNLSTLTHIRRKTAIHCSTPSLRQQRRYRYELQRSKTTNFNSLGSRYAVISQNMNDEELARFRTQICPKKASGQSGECEFGLQCQYSHCISWSRRPPHISGYRPTLCPNVIFSIGTDRKMRVKNYCKRGRSCLYSHTKEEQMYHPRIYKTMPCRDWPYCKKYFCPFAHGPEELRDPELIEFALVQGPEKPEPETEKRAQWAISSFKGSKSSTARDFRTSIHQSRSIDSDADPHSLIDFHSLALDQTSEWKNEINKSEMKGDIESIYSRFGSGQYSSSSLHYNWRIDETCSNHTVGLPTTEEVPNHQTDIISNLPSTNTISIISPDFWPTNDQQLSIVLRGTVSQGSETEEQLHVALTDLEGSESVEAERLISDDQYNHLFQSLSPAKECPNEIQDGTKPLFQSCSGTPSTSGTENELSCQEIGDLVDQLSKNGLCGTTATSSWCPTMNESSIGPEEPTTDIRDWIILEMLLSGSQQPTTFLEQIDEDSLAAVPSGCLAPLPDFKPIPMSTAEENRSRWTKNDNLQNILKQMIPKQSWENKSNQENSNITNNSSHNQNCISNESGCNQSIPCVDNIYYPFFSFDMIDVPNEFQEQQLPPFPVLDRQHKSIAAFISSPYFEKTSPTTAIMDCATPHDELGHGLGHPPQNGQGIELVGSAGLYNERLSSAQLDESEKGSTRHHFVNSHSWNVQQRDKTQSGESTYDDEILSVQSSWPQLLVSMSAMTLVTESSESSSPDRLIVSSSENNQSKSNQDYRYPQHQSCPNNLYSSYDKPQLHSSTAEMKCEKMNAIEQE